MSSSMYHKKTRSHDAAIPNLLALLKTIPAKLARRVSSPLRRSPEILSVGYPVCNRVSKELVCLHLAELPSPRDMGLGPKDLSSFTSSSNFGCFQPLPSRGKERPCGVICVDFVRRQQNQNKPNPQPATRRYLRHHVRHTTSSSQDASLQFFHRAGGA